MPLSTELLFCIYCKEENSQITFGFKFNKHLGYVPDIVLDTEVERIKMS